MFETEAKEYSNNNTKYYEWDAFYADDGEAIEKAYQKGATFGYNKAKEEFATALKVVVNTCNHWQEVAEKANEWHYVKDELPISDKDKYYFVVDKWNEPMIARFYEGVWSNYSTIEGVIAWKEIVLPKEIKE